MPHFARYCCTPILVLWSTQYMIPDSTALFRRRAGERGHKSAIKIPKEQRKLHKCSLVWFLGFSFHDDAKVLFFCCFQGLCNPGQVRHAFTTVEVNLDWGSGFSFSRVFGDSDPMVTLKMRPFELVSSFWIGIFRKAMPWHPDSEVFALAIPDPANAKPFWNSKLGHKMHFDTCFELTTRIAHLSSGLLDGH